MDRPARRLGQLLVGLVLYGVSCALLLRAGLGVDPWDVLHQGLSRSLGWGVGTWTCVVGALVLLLWVPLRQRPGVGTVANVVVIGVVVDAVMASTASPHGLLVRVVLLVTGVLLNGVAGGLYVGAGLGPGPRDGLATAVAARGLPLWAVRTVVEVVVLVAGVALGGMAGVGTVLYALAIGPLVHRTYPAFAVRPRPAAPSPTLELVRA